MLGYCKKYSEKMSARNLNKDQYFLMKKIRVNEGIGGAYERVAYSDVIKKFAGENGCKKILELGATYIAGVPGFNSCLLAQAGYDVTVTVHSRDYAETVKIWSSYEFKGKYQIVEWNNNLETNFENGQFDLVWNHLAFEHYQNPLPLIREMNRIAKNGIMNFTLSPFNIGFPIHWLIHKITRKYWDHGYFKNTLISSMEKAHRKNGLKIWESGGCDVPPWMDTVDAKMGGSMTYFDYSPRAIKDNWFWCSIEKESQNHWLMKILLRWEKLMPQWFKIATAHHLYTGSLKK
jgi:SAM-dependent methyltransferase